jgi:hypothetical protein
MTCFPIFDAKSLPTTRNKYPKPLWPVDTLQIGQAFLIPMENGVDADGRNEAYVRLCVSKAGTRLGHSFSVRQTADKSLTVFRVG